MRYIALLGLAAVLVGCPTTTSVKKPAKETVVRAPGQAASATPPVVGKPVTRDPSLPTLPTDANVLFPSKPPEPDPAAPALTLTTLAGSGTAGLADGVGNAAKFARPTGVAVMADGAVVVADHDNHAIRKVAADGTVSTLTGDGLAGPLGIATAPDGRIFVSDASAKAILQFQAGKLSTLASGVGLLPGGIAFDNKGGLFIADAQDNHIRRLDLATGTVTVLAGNGDLNVRDGKGTAASFNSPQGVACDDQGNAYVGDAGNRRVRKVTPDGTVTSLPLGPVGGNVLFQPGGVAWLAGNTLVVTDLGNGRVLAIPPGTADADPATLKLADGLNTPQGVAVAADGTIYVADTGNHEIRKLAGGVPAPKRSP